MANANRQRLGFADFNAEAKWQMVNLVFLLKGRLLASSANIRLGWPFAILLQRMAKPVAKASLRHLPIRFSELANTPHSPLANAFAMEGANYCKIFYLTNIKSFIALIPSLLLLIKVSLGEKLKSLRRQGGGVGGRAAVTPL
jgi:hypothetical protein